MQMFRSTLRICTYKENVHKQTTLQIEERNTCRLQLRNEISYAIWFNWIFRKRTRLKKHEDVSELYRDA